MAAITRRKQQRNESTQEDENLHNEGFSFICGLEEADIDFAYLYDTLMKKC